MSEPTNEPRLEATGHAPWATPANLVVPESANDVDIAAFLTKPHLVPSGRWHERCQAFQAEAFQVLVAAEREAGELRERNETLIEDFTKLARHHRDCEMLAEQMAQLLGHVQQGHKPPDLGLRIQHIIGSWEAHQWPEIEARAALSTGEDQSAG